MDASSRTAYYSKLPAGEYVFQLRATNENGDWGDVREMEIIIEPPFWATLVGLFYLCIIGYTVYGIDMVGDSSEAVIA